ncbi:thiolase-like protein [Lojkania enalia]|uniref:Thiolase-like protein n=1 Tax=Lojkania enalia TaxID=147567 RepID=A0A9P4JX96_9PLEO|nr:thiolase-like protein [Didymosphaeria enalia]
MTYRSRLFQLQRRRIFFFGSEFPSDELRDVFYRMLLHVKDRRFRLLSAFIKESTRALKDELKLLPHFVQDQVPHFENILHLPEHGNFREGCLGAAMENAFLVVLQVGTFIGHHESNRLGLESVASGALVSGLSIGLFGAAAVSTANTLADMVQTGVASLRVSFRLGAYVQDLSQKLESAQPIGNLQSWTHGVTGMSKEAVSEELSKYNAQNGVSNLSKVFISAVDKAFVGVTGPPSRLRAAFDYSQSLRYSNSLPLPVYDGAYHASHIYTADDVTAIVASSSDGLPKFCNTNIPILSSQHGTPFGFTTASDLLRSICNELLTGTAYLDNVTAAIIQHIVGDGPSSCSFNTFRTSLVTKSVIDGINTALPQRTPLDICDIVSWVFDDYGPRQPASTSDAKLAIVGMACRMPGGANDSDQFWECIERGYDACVKAPPDRFGNATQTEYGNFIDRPGSFDAGFFAMSQKAAEQTNATTRLALVTEYEAMEMAGIVPGRTMSSKSSRIGTFFDHGTVPDCVRSFTNAVDAGCTALWTGEVDTVIAGGANVITDLTRDNHAGLCSGNGSILSKTGQCKVWDKDADGYCRAEGVGAVVIKRLEDAEADNDNILAIVLSAATNHSTDAGSITRPQTSAQEANYRQVLRRAGVDPFDVSFVEIHGTGTQAGDAIEAEAVLNVFAPSFPAARRSPDQRLHLGAVKSNIGHGGAAAGISSLIKVLLCFEHGKIPPHIGIKTKINPAIPRDLARRQVALAGAYTPWPSPGGQKRLAVVNSLGASGGIATLLLEDGPEKRLSTAGTSSNYSLNAMAFSAQSRGSLRANLENMLTYLDQHPSIDLVSLSYTLCARRQHHGLRVGTTANSVAGLQKFIKSSLETGLSNIRPVSTDRPSVVFTFTGEGSAYTGSPNLFAECVPFRGQVIQLDSIVRRLGFDSVIPVIDGSASEEYARHPIVGQLTIVVLEIALARYWVTMGIQPCAVVGHSLGEYSAMAVSGVLSASDALFLVGRRAQLTLDKCVLGSYSMLSVRARPQDIETTLKGDSTTANVIYEIACRNGEKDTVLGGCKDAIAGINHVLQAGGYKCVELAMPFAYHTAQMDAIAGEFFSLACNTPFKSSNIPYISSLLAQVVLDAHIIDADYMRRQTRETVNFAGAINEAMKMGIANARTIWIDIGPHPICAAFIKALLPGSKVLSSCRRNEDNNDTLTKSLVQLHLNGLEPTWSEHFRSREDNCTVLRLPKYSWDEKKY